MRSPPSRSLSTRASSRAWRRAAGLMAAVAMVIPMPASAQLSGLFRPKSSTTKPSADEDCPNNAATSTGKSIIGGMIGGLTNRVTSQLGTAGTYLPSAEVAGVLTDAIACRLNPEEQKQAADATLEVTETETVGATASWNSTSRNDVSGRSTVTDKSQLADGRQCMSVTDVVIVEGEETTVSKKMCKGPGESRYTILA